jgi:hypothetical protein
MVYPSHAFILLTLFTNNLVDQVAARFDPLDVTRNSAKNSNRCPKKDKPPSIGISLSSIVFCPASTRTARKPIPDGLGRENGAHMKVSKSFQGVLIGSALLLANDAFAANKGTLHVSAPEIVAAERLTAGDYTVRWEGTGSRVQLRIMQGEKVMVALPVSVVALDEASPSDTVVIQIDDQGTRRVSRLCFAGRKFAFQIEEDSATASVQGNN